MIINLTLATEQNLNLSIKDFSKIEKIYINNSILLNTQYFGLEKACKGWKFNEKSLKEFLKSAKNMKTGKLLTAFLIKFPVLSKEDFLDNINYFFEINAGGSFEI